MGLEGVQWHPGDPARKDKDGMTPRTFWTGPAEKNSMALSTAFGIELDGDAPQIVRGERRMGRFEWSPANRDDSRIAAVLRAGSTPVGGHLTPRGSFTHWLDVPYASAHKAAQVLPTLLDIQLPFPLEQCLFTFPLLRREKDGRTRALAVAARRTEIEGRVRAYRAAEFETTHLDNEGLALWSQALLEEPPEPGDDGRLRVIAHLARNRWTIVLGRGREFLGSHAVAPQDRGRVQRLLHAHAGGAATEAVWIWSGAAATDTAVVRALHNELAARYPGPSRILDRPESVLARSLARRLVMHDPLACNLLTGPLLHPWLQARRQKKARRPVLLCGLAGAALCLAVFAADTVLAHREAALDRKFQSLADSLAGYRVTAKGRDAVRAVRQALREPARIENPFIQAFSPSHVKELLRIARIARTNRLTIATLELGPGSPKITGTSRDWDAPQALQAALAQDERRLSLHRREDLRHDRIEFSLTPQRPGEAP